ncbi:hypothetical protein ACS0TY_007343 [Phlomoides rotata]
MTPESQSFPPPPISDNGFPMLAITILGITATAFLLISYYIFITKCCFRWQMIDPLRRFSNRTRVNEDPSTSYSPSWQSRGLNELLIREIPTLQYKKHDKESSSLSKCVVCLNEFQDLDMLRLLPKCNHAFHLDCIDVWLLTNSNCPLCRSAISGRNRYRPDRIVAPNSSPQDPQQLQVTDVERGDSSRKIEQKKSRKFHHVSIMGDEGIDVREKDDQFCIQQPIRRSFSMDSAGDRCIYLSVQEIVRQNREVRDSEEEEGSSRSRRSIFSFGNGRGYKNAVLPY